MKERDKRAAEAVGVYDRICELEKALLALDRVPSVDWDLDGFWDSMWYVILVPEYDIPANLPNYFEVRRQVLHSILEVTRKFGLWPTGDSIEDYGRHWYIVRKCDSSWEFKR